MASGSLGCPGQALGQDSLIKIHFRIMFMRLSTVRVCSWAAALNHPHTSMSKPLPVSGVSSLLRKWWNGCLKPQGWRTSEHQASLPQPSTGPLVLNSNASKKFSQSTLSMSKLYLQSHKGDVPRFCFDTFFFLSNAPISNVGYPAIDIKNDIKKWFSKKIIISHFNTFSNVTLGYPAPCHSITMH